VPRRKTPAKPISKALFLGAGASAAFGYPTTDYIFPRIRERLLSRKLFPIESNPTRERAKMRRLRDYLTKFFPSIFDEGVQLPLITDVLSLIDFLLSTGEIGVPKVSARDMEDFRTLLEEAIVHSIEGAWSDWRSNPLLDRLGDWMVDHGAHGTPLTVISTNYDNLVEPMVFEKIEMDDPELGTAGDAVDLGFNWREHSGGYFLETVHYPPRSPRIRIFKLHGSFSWLRCPLCGFIYVNNVAGSIVYEAFREDKVDSSNTCVCGHAPVRPVIVAPSMVRSIKDPDLLTIWRSALEALRVADEWIVVGYSLPPEDIAIRSILLRAYRGRGPKARPPVIRVVQRDEDRMLEARYKLLFPEVGFEYGGFERFVESLPEPSKHYETF
jgi:hypothetical protein